MSTSNGTSDAATPLGTLVRHRLSRADLGFSDDSARYDSSVYDETAVRSQDSTRIDEPTTVESADVAVSATRPPTRQHQQVCHRLVNALEAVLPESFDVVAGWAWQPGSEQFVPDVMVFHATDESDRFTDSPALVVEVLAGNRAADLVLKTTKYAAAGLTHFWVVDTADMAVTAFVREGAHFRTEDVLTGRGVLDFGIARVKLNVPSLIG